MIDHGITIVVSPLLALMNNQVAALRAASIAVATLNSNTLTAERQQIIDDLKCGHPLTRLLYVTPEYTLTETFRKHLKTVHSQGELARIAIDEAHCISEWGHDFRPAYAHLSYFRQAFLDVPIICLTATATPTVRKDIIKILGLDSKKLKIFCTSTSRPNLHYEIRFSSDSNDIRFDSLVNWLHGIYDRRSSSSARPTAVSGIIYTSRRDECTSLSNRLRTKGIGAAPYHAGLSTHERTECQQRWISGEAGYDIIVATTAFGMGIDKQNVRFVVHWCLPKSLEGYYQEAGRAGRDGKAAACVLYYSREDRDRVAYRLAKDNAGTGNGSAHDNKGHEGTDISTQAKGRADSFQELVKYCEGTKICRHQFISSFFGEGQGGASNPHNALATSPEALETGRWPGCDFACDFCKDRQNLKERKRDGLASEEWVSTQRERDGESWWGGDE